MTDPTLEFFFDIGSGFSYLASSQVDALAARHGATVRWRPFVLGFVLKASGNDNPARVPAKGRWLAADMARWAERYGMPLRFPSRFPVQSLAAQRLLVAAGLAHGEAAVPRLARPLFALAWAEDRDVADAAELRRAVAAAGLDPAPLLAAVELAETKAALKANTDEAVARGAFGAPTFFVGDQLFWGNDRLDFVAEALRGARPRG